MGPVKSFCKRGHKRTDTNVYASNLGCIACARFLAKRNAPRKRKLANGYKDALKLDILTHYGPKGTLGCCWKKCSVTDIDVLTIDHINNDGYLHILPGDSTRLRGMKLYTWIRQQGYPKTFQTLCANHQLKKRILLARKLRKENQ